MHVINRRVGLTGIVSLICILMMGCGDSSQPIQETETREQQTSWEDENNADPKDMFSYSITESVIPSSEDSLTQDILRGDNWVAREKESLFWDGSFYRLSDLFEMVEEKNIFVGACIQVLAPPYEQWESQAIFYHEDDSNNLRVDALAGVTEDGILLRMLSRSDEKPRLTRLAQDGGLEVLMEIPGDFADALWYQDGGQLWALSGGGRTLTAFNDAGQQGTGQNLTGRVIGFLENPQSGETVWYGFEQGELVLWDKPGGQVQVRVTDQINQYEDFGIGYSASGELLLADTDRVWAYDGQTISEIFSFSDNDYSPEEIYGLGFREDGTTLILVMQDGEERLLTAKKVSGTDMAEKQEVLIVINNANPGLEKLAARYNRESGEYRVKIVSATEEAEPEEYRARVQMEMVAGGGPDLLGDWTVNISECVTQGYLAPLDEAVEDRSLFLESAFATGETNGELYGIPYNCYPYFLAVSSGLMDADSWTLDQMYQAVGNSPAEMMEADIDGVNIIMSYGLHDEGNKAFIDWEKGESHLTERPFLELMAFAKEYADRGGYPRSEVGERLGDGQIAGAVIVLTNPGMLNRARGCFDGEAVCIGYPRETGAGVYMETSRLYLNRNAGNREGAMDFLRYLLSEEGQRQYMEYCSWMYLPVRRSLLQESLERYQQDVKVPPVQSHDDKGIYYELSELDEEQIETFWRILDNAVPAVFKADDIWSIVDEELQPYFNNARSAEDAAAALHSRVQVYLDEQK